MILLIKRNSQLWVLAGTLNRIPSSTKLREDEELGKPMDKEENVVQNKVNCTTLVVFGASTHKRQIIMQDLWLNQADRQRENSIRSISINQLVWHK